MVFGVLHLLKLTQEGSVLIPRQNSSGKFLETGFLRILWDTS